ncbi:Calcineurin-like phosphoesterase domain, lpxH type [uncultured Caudovirales phage]|uniref:Calcineurin-like phosphoesterase domain, lpxH type n=1 Tax=uncultured Caudovirales phage TaxID=2100421 RepID=A0A6J5N5H2_9CAUD|nr:Calcineurin-like phosphoesterase domain, lpxH type [uncultured Caudovirales phage]
MFLKKSLRKKQMNNNPDVKIILEYLEKYKHLPSLTLAKLIYKNNPESFATIGNIRSRINYYRGKSGKKHRKEITNKKFMEKESRPLNPFVLPESDAKKRIVYKLEGKKIGLLYDIHIPYHDVTALNLALMQIEKEGCDAIALVGDALDCYSLSTFEKDAKKRNFKEELYAMRQFLHMLRERFPDAHLYYKEGNHEDRYWRYMRLKAPELIDIDAFSFQELLHLDKNNVHYIEGKSKATFGKLNVFHGHEFPAGSGSPTSVSKSLYNKTKTDSVCGHHHQTSENQETNANGEIVMTYSVGCLCELSPDYMPFNRWNLGFGIAELINKKGDYKFTNYRIHDGKIK